MIEAEGAPTPSCCDEEALQPGGSVTVMPTVMVGPAPDVYVIDRVPAPAVIVPPVMTQSYVAPAPASGTDAVWLVELGQTAVSTVIAADGICTTCTVRPPEIVAEQPEVSAI